MANTFSFHMNEDFLRNYADYLKQLKETNPGREYSVSISVDLIPDGIGYEISSSHIEVVEVKADDLPTPHP